MDTTDPVQDPRELADNDAGSPSYKGFKPGWRFYLAFSSLSVITLMAALDATSISVALPIMARALGGSALEAFWSGTSFILTSTVFQPVLGSFSHIFGRKPMIMLSLALFGAGAIIAAVADNFTVVLVGRSIQGVGGGGIIVLTEVVVTDMVPLRERGKWFSFISSMWAVGTVIGPLLGGGFAEDVTWRWIFWINLPFIGIGAVLIILFLSLNYKTGAFVEKLKRVDWIGATLFIASTTGLLIPITWGGVMYPWDHWRTLFPLLLCAVGLIGFVAYEKYVAPEPLIRNVFTNVTAAITYFGTFIHGLILWCLLYYLPLYYEAVKGFSPIVAGVALMPQTLTVAPAAIAVGAAVAITGRYRWAIWSGWVLTTFGAGLLIYLKVDTTTVEWVFINLVSGLGTGILFPAMALTVQAAAAEADAAYAATMFAFFRAFGQSVGVAVGGTVFQNQVKKKLESYPLLAPMAEEYSRDASALVEIIKAMPDSAPEKLMLRTSYVDGLKYVFIVLTALSAVTMVSSFWTKAFPLDRELETEQGFQEKQAKKDEEKTSATPSQ
ncbi:major facilitator superfamily domain-containing protein [Lineolata rhizophorae]|uniref:Major facilitator superfamily domain-containing protein n=1 Tax=Lineolata rhizophorae TaxID=578093 RepID=A0A6A6P868_9PEZI|nr:major facilitator superfamily domain-containing protein [Lineolata rhizophorae]